jgi:hypothetical protein
VAAKGPYTWKCQDPGSGPCYTSQLCSQPQPTECLSHRAPVRMDESPAMCIPYPGPQMTTAMAFIIASIQL